MNQFENLIGHSFPIILGDDNTTITALKEEIQRIVDHKDSIDVFGEKVAVKGKKLSLDLFKIENSESKDTSTHYPSDITSLTEFYDSDCIFRLMLTDLNINITNIGIKISDCDPPTDSTQLKISK